MTRWEQWSERKRQTVRSGRRCDTERRSKRMGKMSGVKERWRHGKRARMEFVS